MSSLGPESSRPILCLLCSPRSIPTHVSSSNLPPNRGLERALEEASSSGVLNLSSRKLKEFPQTAANHDLSDTVEAGMGSGGPAQGHITRGLWCRQQLSGSLLWKGWNQTLGCSLSRPVCSHTQFDSSHSQGQGPVTGCDYCPCSGIPGWFVTVKRPKSSYTSSC